MVWTDAWTGTAIGHSTSKDLRTWTAQQALPLGVKISGCSVMWAPEIFWDDIQKLWQITWSTSVNSGDKHFYYATTTDLSDTSKYSAPALLFNPGFNVIDADMMKVADGKYMMVFKDERNTSLDIHFVYAPTPQGPWKGPKLRGSDTVVSATIASNGTEGPCIVKVGKEYHLYFDPYYTTTTYRMVKVKNLDTLATPWPSAGSLKNSTGADFTYSHSNIITVPRDYVLWMLYKKCLPTSLTAPANKSSVGVTGSLALTWTANADTSKWKAKKYRVQISTNSTFSSTVVDDSSATAGSLTVQIGNLAQHTWHYWRVAGVSDSGGLGTWSSVYSFKTSDVGILDHNTSTLPKYATGAHGVLEVYQASGARIAEFAYNGSSKATRSASLSNAKAGLAKGCYTYRLKVDSKVVESGSFIKN